jgi:hypothetical protein
MQREAFDFSFIIILSYSTFLLGDFIYLLTSKNQLKMKTTNQQTLNIVRYVITGIGLISIIVALTIAGI